VAGCTKGGYSPDSDFFKLSIVVHSFPVISLIKIRYFKVNVSFYQFNPPILISDVYDGKIKYERPWRVFAVEIRKYHQKIPLDRNYIFQNIRIILLFFAQFQANFLP
jgi:hypothetical protein